MAEISILQLNIFQGKFLDRVISFVKEHDVDILHFQEVSGGQFSGGGEYTYPDNRLQAQAEKNASSSPQYAGLNIFQEIKKRLNFEGIFAPRVVLKGDHDSFNANATFFKKSFPLIEHKIFWLKEFYEAEDRETVNWKGAGYNAIATRFEVGNKKLWTVNTHLAWGPRPFDEDYKLEINMPLVEHMREMEVPWILSGDFNVDKNSATVKALDELGRNLAVENNFTNTLNPRIHPAQNLFPPGLAVDFVFTSPEIKVTNCQLIDSIDLSDHFGILTQIEI